MLDEIQGASSGDSANLINMELKPPSQDYLAELRQELIKGFRDEESYGYLKANPQWREFVGI